MSGWPRAAAACPLGRRCNIDCADQLKDIKFSSNGKGMFRWRKNMADGQLACQGTLRARENTGAREFKVVLIGERWQCGLWAGSATHLVERDASERL